MTECNLQFLMEIVWARQVSLSPEGICGRHCGSLCRATELADGSCVLPQLVLRGAHQVKGERRPVLDRAQPGGPVEEHGARSTRMNSLKYKNMSEMASGINIHGITTCRTCCTVASTEHGIGRKNANSLYCYKQKNTAMLMNRKGTNQTNKITNREN